MEQKSPDRKLLFLFSSRVESFSQHAREGTELPFSFISGTSMRLRVADGRVEVLFANPLCEHDVELTFQDRHNFVLGKARGEGRREEQVLRGPPSQLILDHLLKTGQDLLLLHFLFFKPTQSLPEGALQYLRNTHYPAIRRRRLPRSCTRCRFMDDRRRTSNELIPALEGLSISPEVPPSFSERPVSLVSSISPDQPPLSSESAATPPPQDLIRSQDSVDFRYPAARRRRLLQFSVVRCHVTDDRRATSDRLIPALEGLSISPPERPPSSSQPLSLVEIALKNKPVNNPEVNMSACNKYRGEVLLNKVNEFFTNVPLESEQTGIPHLRYTPY